MEAVIMLSHSYPTSFPQSGTEFLIYLAGTAIAVLASFCLATLLCKGQEDDS